MKKAIILFSVLFQILNAQITWTEINTGTSLHIRDISFINVDTGFIAGDAGLLKMTTNGGTTWTNISIPSSGQGVGNNNNIKVAQLYKNGTEINAVLFFDKFTNVMRAYNSDFSAWYGECGSSIFMFNDSICSINNYHSTVASANYEAVAGVSYDNLGGMIGSFGGFCFSFDTLLTQNSFSGWYDVSYKGNHTIYVGDDGYYYYTSPSYDTILQFDASYKFLSVDYSNDNVVYASRNEAFYPFTKSVDFGLTFQIDSLHPVTFYYPEYTEIDFIENDFGVMVGKSSWNGGVVTVKNGNVYEMSGTDTILTSVTVIDSMTAFVGGLNGKLYKMQRNNIGLENFEISETSWNLFPNPANEVIHINSQEEIISVEVLNSLGKVILRKNSNDHNFVLNSNNLDSGIYFVRIQTPKGNGTKKLIINK